jgi:opacity protein-like surface antigen
MLRKNSVLFLIIFICAGKVSAQKTSSLADLNIGFSKNVTTVSLGYIYNWHLGKKHKFFIGTGARFNQFSGKKLNYTSAPAGLAGDKATEDTVLLAKSSISSLNILVNLGYNITDKIQLGFDIDAAGFSFGGKQAIIFNGTLLPGELKPSGGNILLVGNNDRGSLNSNFYARYKFNEHWGAKLSYQYYFSEYTASAKIQTAPKQNDRFRYKSQGISIGVAYHF